MEDPWVYSCQNGMDLITVLGLLGNKDSKLIDVCTGSLSSGEVGRTRPRTFV